MRKKIIFFFLLHVLIVHGQQDEQFFDMSIEELLNTTIEVTNKQKTKILEAPAIVSFITQEEIKYSGARDLLDVLHAIPGIQFGHDVETVVGISMRGFWGHEGKVLILWDGIEMNENLFACTQFGNHYDIQAIKRIEIIRGPGSALYGGYAGLCVVNIITKDGNDGNMISISNTAGTFYDRWSRINGNLSITKKWENGVNLGIHGLYGQSIRSNQNFTDFYGDTFDMGEGKSSLIRPAMLSAKLEYKNFLFTSQLDEYYLHDRVVFGNNAPESQVIRFRSLNTKVLYKIKLSEKLDLLPSASVKRNVPWQKPKLPAVIPFHYDKTAYRYNQNLLFNYTLSDKINFQWGLDSYQDYCIASKHSTSDELFKDSTYNALYYNFAGFAQATLHTKIANFTAGLRYDKHNAFAGALSPRFVINRTFSDKLTLKMMASGAFRSPVIENIRLAELNKNSIKPERIYTFEGGATYKFDKNFYVSFNVFNVRLLDPIIYTTDTVSEYYYNFDQADNAGVEVEGIFKRQWGSVTFNYSYYHNVKNKIALFEVPNRRGILLGNAKHKVYTEVNLRPTKSVNLNINQVFLSQRYGYVGVDTIAEYKPVFMTNLYLSYQNVMKIENLELGVGIYNIFNENFRFIQPYNGGVSVLPSLNREFLIRVQYRFKV
ncbi:MAG: TonB-dependent receptor plug domain-containing protein [Bacteroidia bacterium]|nr:TonB-dependent receptor plug domain-containing protein [Bacteroidia bacterium]MDW8345678.1 TonB-dependent receptor plug domain-containing protein [Bacteroidia bacterium]